MGVPLPCQKQPTMKDDREHSGDIHTAPELCTRSSGARGRQPDKDEVGGSSPPRPTQVTSSAVKQLIAPVGGWPSRMSAPLENEAIAPLENEASQTDWLGDLCGGLGADPAAGRGRGAAAAGRASAGYRQVNGGAGGRVGGAAEV